MIKKMKRRMIKNQLTKSKIPKTPSLHKKIIRRIAKFLIKKMPRVKSRLLKSKQEVKSRTTKKTLTLNLWRSSKKGSNNKSQRRIVNSSHLLKTQKERKSQISMSNKENQLHHLKEKEIRTVAFRKVRHSLFSHHKQNGLTSVAYRKSKGRRLPNKRNRTALGI
jgi:hypothetical protein